MDGQHILNVMQKSTASMVFSALFLLLAGTLYWDVYWELIWSALAISGLAYGVAKKQALDRMLLALACLAPLSIKLSLPFAEVYLPIEFVASAAALSVLFLVVPQGNVRWFLNYPLPLFWLISFLPGIYFSDLLNTSLKFTALNGVFVIAFYYGAVLVAERGKSVPYLPFIAALLPVTVMGVYHFAQYGFNPITISGIFKPFFYSHTMYGAVMAFIAAIALGNLRQKRLWKWILLASIILTLFSGSRAALWSLVFMFVLYVLVQFPAVYRVVLPVLAMGAIFVFGGALKVQDAFAYNNYESHDPQASLVEKSMSVTNVQTDASNIERLNRWVSALRMFEERPYFGFGPGTYQFTYIPFQEKRLENRLTVTNPNAPPPGSGGTAHSELLLQLSENGILTPLIFLFMWMRWWYFGFFSIAKRSPLLPLFLGLSTYFFHMQFNNFLNQPVFAFLFWATAAYFDFQLSSKDDELLR
ncbi:MAG: O-antigen ligase family protein [Schleiferiaceae bacterium]|nr:O-antigen ligase family protein [Schleiferiaceae bacterium]